MYANQGMGILCPESDDDEIQEVSTRPVPSLSPFPPIWLNWLDYLDENMLRRPIEEQIDSEIAPPIGWSSPGEGKNPLEIRHAQKRRRDEQLTAYILATY